MTAPLLESNPLVDLRVSLIRNGYRITAVDGKRPRIKGWQRANWSIDQVEGYTRTYADHLNTGILTGEVVAIDIDVPHTDTAEKLIERLTAFAGASSAPCRTGNAPKCLFIFRADASASKMSTAEYIVDGSKCQVEVLGQGQQFVAYGTHPETGKEYVWSNGDPITVPFTELPEIDPATLAAFLADAETILADAGTPLRKQEPTQSRPRGDTFWTKVNAAALADPETWVPSLFPTARREAGTGAWRVSSSDLGRALEEDISIHPDGIRDFGTEQPSTPIQLVLDYGGAPTPKDAAHWLCERMGQDPSDLGWEVRQPVRISYGSASTPEADNDDVADAEFMPVSADTSAGLAESLCYPPGAVGEFARFITSCARFPSPHLALVSALALTAGLIGRRYKGPTGLRSNIYIVGLAESGFGKDITIRAAEALADSTQDGERVSQHIFADKLRSLPGLAGRLKKSPSCISTIDEFGKFLGLHTGRGVAPHREEITTALMELTGAPAGSWGGQEKAGGNIPRVIQPCLTIHGISTPATFWAALSSGNIDEGLLGRLVIIDAGNAEPRKVRQPAGDIDAVPEDLAELVAGLLGQGGGKFGGGPFYALNAKFDERPFPLMSVEFAPGVDDVFEAFDDRVRAMRSGLDPHYRPILNRVGENAARLALIVAVGCDPKSPIITREIQEWANHVAEASFYTIIRGARENIADNEKSAEYLRVRNMVARSEGAGLARGIIDRRLKGSIETRRVDDILSTLQRAGEIRFGKIVSDSGQTKVRYWASEHLPDAAEVVA